MTTDPFPAVRHIQYAINNDGLIYSRVGSEVAFPVLEYDRIGENGNFNAALSYHLERASVYAFSAEWDSLVWTKKVPTELKNFHRAFWGLSALRDDAKPFELPRGVEGLARENWEIRSATIQST